MYINIVHFFSKTFGAWAENNPMRSSIVTNAIFMQNMIKTHQLEHVFSNFSGSKLTHSKSVARCVAIIGIYFIINSVTF